MYIKLHMRFARFSSDKCWCYECWYYHTELDSLVPVWVAIAIARVSPAIWVAIAITSTIDATIGTVGTIPIGAIPTIAAIWVSSTIVTGVSTTIGVAIAVPASGTVVA